MTQHRWIPKCTTMLLALATTVAFAAPSAGQQDQGRGRGPDHNRFDDHDRQVTRTWYDAHQRSLPIGLRATDRLSPSIELEFHEGYVVNRQLRVQVHSVPSDLLRLLGPLPRGDRYVILSGHIIVIDGNYRVLDVIHLGHDR
jgi:hypothetical protein